MCLNSFSPLTCLGKPSAVNTDYYMWNAARPYYDVCGQDSNRDKSTSSSSSSSPSCQDAPFNFPCAWKTFQVQVVHVQSELTAQTEE